jgi:transposase
MGRPAYPSDLTDKQWALIGPLFPWHAATGRPRRWRTDGTWDQVLDTLRAKVRNHHGRADEPTAATLHSQSVPNAGPADQVGYDAGKGIRGRKRHVLVDCLGLLIAVAVTSAYVSDQPQWWLAMPSLTPWSRRFSSSAAELGPGTWLPIGFNCVEICGSNPFHPLV